MSALHPKGLAPMPGTASKNKRSRILCLTKREVMRRFRLKKPVYTTIGSLIWQMGRADAENVLVASPFTIVRVRQPPKSES